ncbi:PREDICTED: uncharacterized protein LOC105154455 [Acromyrmex echinatior]|uniref:uncharacterized protein LOC105154455 n=1 Tax=Acromyrmex echinatior TaxID=103372 RepID=UPI000580D445|nr:PREDICTED: uncharacterized protein LOC105154455 [Acromyrmex echinatior]
MFVYKRTVDVKKFRSSVSEVFLLNCSTFRKKMDTNVDLLKFTKQTETLLCGVGAQNLIKECKRRNISTYALHRLTKEDFIQLGADPDHAENIANALCISKKKQHNVKPKSHYRILDKIEILQVGERQLSIIQDFVKYCKLKLKKERINFFVEADKALSASQILCMSAEATLKEVSEAELKLKELEAMIVMPRNSRKYSYILYSISFGGFCVATFILLNRLWR